MTVTTEEHSLDVTDVFVLEEDLDKPLAFVITYHRYGENLKLLHSEVYIDLSHVIYGVYVDSSLIEAYIGFSFKQHNQYIGYSLIIFVSH